MVWSYSHHYFTGEEVEAEGSEAKCRVRADSEPGLGDSAPLPCPCLQSEGFIKRSDYTFGKNETGQVFKSTLG